MNAIHTLNSGLFVGLDEGRKKKLSEIQALIIEDTELQNSSEVQKKEIIAKLVLHCNTSKQGARFNNAAAAADFQGTLKKSLEEVCGVFFCSHLYSTHPTEVWQPQRTNGGLYLCLLNVPHSWHLSSFMDRFKRGHWLHNRGLRNVEGRHCPEVWAMGHCLREWYV